MSPVGQSASLYLLPTVWDVVFAGSSGEMITHTPSPANGLCPDAVGDATLAPVSPEAVVGMAVYTAGAMLHGKGHVWEMMVESIP